MTTQERFLHVFLRILGSVSLLALFAVVMPYSWMNAIHQWLGMGELPDEPIVGYLARSTSAFYALLGGLVWVLSFDLARHRRVLKYVGAAILAMGLMLLSVDWLEGMPRWWTIQEGPVVIGFGIVGVEGKRKRWCKRAQAVVGISPKREAIRVDLDARDSDFVRKLHRSDAMSADQRIAPRKLYQGKV